MHVSIRQHNSSMWHQPLLKSPHVALWPSATLCCMHPLHTCSTIFRPWKATTLTTPPLRQPPTSPRQRHPNGNPELKAQLARHFRLPATWSDPTPAAQLVLYQAWLYLSQVQQMMCYNTALGTWRRLRWAAAL